MSSSSANPEKIGGIALADLQLVPELRFYFRYPLRAADFRPVIMNGRLLGHYAAKPLYGRLTPAGRVDRSAGLSGEIVVLLVPAAAASPDDARLLFTAISEKRVRNENGRRNWPAIRQAAEEAIHTEIGR